MGSNIVLVAMQSYWPHGILGGPIGYELNMTNNTA
jgi:hypothetical protein